jgi:hypothetical protein
VRGQRPRRRRRGPLEAHALGGEGVEARLRGGLRVERLERVAPQRVHRDQEDERRPRRRAIAAGERGAEQQRDRKDCVARAHGRRP